MIATVRTTVTLDPDVEKLIRDAIRERGISFKQALNDAARAGLRSEKQKRAGKFIQTTYRMGEEQAFRWGKALEAALSGKETVGFSWNVLLAFLRLTTRPGLFRNALQPAAAFELMAAWLDQPAAVVVHPGPRHLAILRGLLEPLGAGGNLTSDAHLAAIAMEH